LLQTQLPITWMVVLQSDRTRAGLAVASRRRRHATTQTMLVTGWWMKKTLMSPARRSF